MKHSMLLKAVCVPLLSSVALAQWSDDFESYAPNVQIVGQGGWEEWSTGSGALVSNAMARSGVNSVDISGATDLVHQYQNYTSGKWVYRAWQYVPSTMSGQSYFILLSDYYYPSGPYTWAVQVQFSVAAGVVGDAGGSTGGATLPIVLDDWVEIKVLIDLDHDWCQFYYNNTLLDDPNVVDHPTIGGGWRWTGGPFGASTGLVNIAAVDLYANSATAVYYDDISLEPFVFETFGQSCPGSMGDVSFNVLQPPTVGGVFLLEIGNLPVSSCFQVLGFNNFSTPLGPLPLDLGPYGAPGCMLNVNPDFAQFIMGSNNVALYVLPLPPDPNLIGLTLHQQILALDPLAGNTLNAVSSAGATLRAY